MDFSVFVPAVMETLTGRDFKNLKGGGKMKLGFNANWYSKEVFTLVSVIVCENTTEGYFQIFQLKIFKFVISLYLGTEE